MRKKINITIYCDEIKNMSLSDKITNTIENWDYIGILIVPTKNIKELVFQNIFLIFIQMRLNPYSNFYLKILLCMFYYFYLLNIQMVR